VPPAPPPLRQPLSGSLRRSGLRWAAGVIGLGIGLLLLASVASSAAFPRIHVAGDRLVITALLAALGTGAGPLLPLAALAAGFAVARTASRRGEAAAAETLGLGRLRMWAALLPLWALLALLCLGVGFGAEPVAWRAIHQVRGAPLAAAVAWAGLSQGEVRVLGNGGALVLQQGQLRFTTGDGLWHGRAGSFSPVPDQATWEAVDVQLVQEGGGRWQVDALEARLSDDRRERWLAPPTSPWSLGWRDLWRRSGHSERASLVAHRRLALGTSVPLLALLGWLIGWTPGSRRSARWWRSPAVAAVAVALFTLTRAADHAVASGQLSGALAGWLPAIAAGLTAGLVLWSGRRR
jgi:predicted membrane protein